MTITNEVLDELLSSVSNADDLLGEQGLMKELKVRLMERMLGAELTEHLGYEPEAQPSDYQSNRRNGTTRKTLKGNDGALPIDVPRDRDGSFEPELIKKGQTRIDGMEVSLSCMMAWCFSTKGHPPSTTAVSVVVPPMSEITKSFKPVRLQAPITLAAGPDATVSIGRSRARSTGSIEPSLLTIIKGTSSFSSAIALFTASTSSSMRAWIFAFRVAL